MGDAWVISDLLHVMHRFHESKNRFFEKHSVVDLEIDQDFDGNLIVSKFDPVTGRYKSLELEVTREELESLLADELLEMKFFTRASNE
jgi:hypothetical protein